MIYQLVLALISVVLLNYSSAQSDGIVKKPLANSSALLDKLFPVIKQEIFEKDDLTNHADEGKLTDGSNVSDIELKPRTYGFGYPSYGYVQPGCGSGFGGYGGYPGGYGGHGGPHIDIVVPLFGHGFGYGR